MSHKQFLVKKINGGLASGKWGKLEGQNQDIKIWGVKIEQLKLKASKSINCKTSKLHLSHKKICEGNHGCCKNIS
jgi:threonine dehydratase